MKWKLVLLLTLLLSLGLTMTASAHGAKIEYTISMAVEIRAAYDTGEPMAGGQVTVYAPDDPSTPWLTGVCDEEGRFVFTPDPSKPGTWDVQVRQSGHGDMVHIPIGEDVAMTGGTGYTPLQIVLMGACVVWGFVGTGLFFSRRHVLSTAEGHVRSPVGRHAPSPVEGHALSSPKGGPDAHS
jgi:nickel transport protein